MSRATAGGLPVVIPLVSVYHSVMHVAVVNGATYQEVTGSNTGLLHCHI